MTPYFYYVLRKFSIPDYSIFNVIEVIDFKVKFKSFTHLAKSLKNKTNDQRFAPCSHFLDLFAELLVGSCHVVSFNS